MNKAIEAQINKRIDNIKSNIHNMQNSRAAIIGDLIYLSDHKRELKAVTGKTFEEIVKELTGFSRRYLNQLVGNYKYLEKYGRLELFNTIDVKAIEHVKKINKPELLEAPEKLTRPQTGDRLPIIEAEVIPAKQLPPPLPSIKAQIKQYISNQRDPQKAAQNIIEFIRDTLKSLK